jgi:hypothetical protein
MPLNALLVWSRCGLGTVAILGNRAALHEVAHSAGAGRRTAARKGGGVPWSRLVQMSREGADGSCTHVHGFAVRARGRGFGGAIGGRGLPQRPRGYIPSGADGSRVADGRASGPEVRVRVPASASPSDLGARFRRDGRDAAERERATGTRRPARVRRRADEDEILNALRARLTTKRFFKARPGFAPGWTAMQTVAYLLGHRASLQR